MEAKSDGHGGACPGDHTQSAVPRRATGLRVPLSCHTLPHSRAYLAVFGRREFAFTQRVEFPRSRGRSSEAEHQLPKLRTRVRFPSPALALCGLPRDLAVLTHSDDDEEWDLDWKFLAVRRVVEQDPRSFVWIDDAIDFLRDEAVSPREWADNISTPSLLIALDTRTGLLPRQLDAVEEFVRQHGGNSEVDETGET